MIAGFDALGALHPNYPFKMFCNQLSLIKKPIALGLFTPNTFTEDMKTFRQKTRILCEIPCVKLLRFQAHWHDNHRELCPIPHLRKIAKFTDRLTQRYKHVEFGISHTAEYITNNDKALIKRVDIIKDIAPEAFTVNNPMTSGQKLNADVFEHHHNKIVGAGEGVSLDGMDAFHEVSDVRLWLKKNTQAKYALIWWYLQNLRDFKEEKRGIRPKPRPERDKRVTKQQMIEARGWL